MASTATSDPLPAQKRPTAPAAQPVWFWNFSILFLLRFLDKNFVCLFFTFWEGGVGDASKESNLFCIVFVLYVCSSMSSFLWTLFFENQN